AKEQAEARRAEVAVRRAENQLESLAAETRVKVAEERQRSAIGVQKATSDAEANVAGVNAQIVAEEQRVEMLRAQFEAEILTPAEAEKERMILTAQAEAAELKGRAQAEIDQLNRTISIVQKGGKAALDAYMIENFERFVRPFAETMSLFPVKHATVISGASGSHAPISGIHPHPVEEQKARLVQNALGAIATGAAAEPVEDTPPEPPPEPAKPEPAAESPRPYRIRPARSE
ncbi:MAG: hypothetical protein ABGY41_01385, partial [Candidatus Poribacteria bacterium]